MLEGRNTHHTPAHKKEALKSKAPTFSGFQ
uniref:Uncharacterized protein n=1 Tax=Arundo donax TaxID=35708 RepID=A0A0A9AZA1_ARUDO